MGYFTPFAAASATIREPSTRRYVYGQLPERVIAAVVDLQLWGAYAYIDLLAGRSGWIKGTYAALAGATDRSAGTMRARAIALEGLGLIMIEPVGRKRILRTARRRREERGRLPGWVVDATGRVDLWGLYAWLDFHAGRDGELRLSYAELAAELALPRARVNRLLLEAEQLGLVALSGYGSARLISLRRGGTDAASEPRSAAISAHAPGEPLAAPLELDAAASRTQVGRPLTRPVRSPINPHKLHTYTTNPNRIPDPRRDIAGDADLIQACRDLWVQVLGPLPHDAGPWIERYVRTGRGPKLLDAIGWTVGRGANCWRYVEEVLLTEGWLHPPASKPSARSARGSRPPSPDKPAVDAWARIAVRTR